MSIKRRNLDTELVNWMIQQGLGTIGFAGTGPSGYEGKIFYVNGQGGSDSFEGTSPEEPFATFDNARSVVNGRITWSNTPWAPHDVIIVYPDTYVENLTSVPYGAIVIGLFGGWDLKDGQMGPKIVPSSGDAVNVASCINTAWYNMGFHCAASSDAFDADILNNVLFDGCYFTGPVETSTARGITSLDSVKLTVRNCRFSCLDKGINIDYADSGDSFSHALIIDSIFDQIDTAGIEISASLVGPSSLVKGCSFHGSGVTMSYAINDGAAILDVSWCDAESTSGFSGCRSVNASYNNGALVT